MVDLLLQPTPDQRLKIDRVLTDAAQAAERIDLGPREGAELRRYEAGFAARGALRAVLTPRQLKDWDESSAPKDAPAARAARPGQPNDAEASYFTRFETMELATREGPFTAAQKEKMLEKIRKARADVAAAVGRADHHQAAPHGPEDRPDPQAVAARRGGHLQRQGTGPRAAASHVNAQVLTLNNPGLSLDHLWVGDATTDLKLTADQKAAIDKILADRVEKLKQVDHDARPDDSPAVVRMRRDQVALATRAAVRAVLTPEQLKLLDAPPGR